jgi:hypothetical protein
MSIHTKNPRFAEAVTRNLFFNTLESILKVLEEESFSAEDKIKNISSYIYGAELKAALLGIVGDNK